MTTSMNEKKMLAESATGSMKELNEAELEAVAGGKGEVTVGISVTIKF